MWILFLFALANGGPLVNGTVVARATRCYPCPKSLSKEDGQTEKETFEYAPHYPNRLPRFAREDPMSL